MAKNEKNNKNLIVGICSALAVLAVVIVVVVLVINNGNRLDDSYFKSDDAKYVLTIDSDMLEAEEGEEYVPVKIHYVYTYSGDKITGLKSYYEYADANTAKAAFEQLKSRDDSAVMEVNGKYVVMTAPESEYENDTATDVKQRIELIDMINSGNYPSGVDEAVDDSEVVEENVVEENVVEEVEE